ncbi:fibrinogen-like protein A [Saccostrea echinata]|uniref:fibrinogen-like protein A n=1 Tax=Saccostrea echinata TaxID=191078 RepID=UPI002A7F9FE1|nr:fibrinogen-like protein A [Saccostrea echinata]
MVQKIQNLVMDVIDNKNSTQNMNKRLNDVIKELQESEDRHQRIRKENLKLQEELKILNETLGENKNRTEKMIQNLKESEISFLKRQTLDLQKKNQALTNENMDTKSRLEINHKIITFVNNSQTGLKEEIQETKTAVAENSQNDRLLRNELQELRNKNNTFSEEKKSLADQLNRMNKTQYNMLEDIFKRISVSINKTMNNIRENVNQSILQLSDKISRVDSRLFPRYCYDRLKRNPSLKGKDDVYDIVVDSKITSVYCDMTTDGGGWTVLQKRIDGSTDFYRTWEEYKHGFGHPKKNYWIGNDAIHALTKDQDQELRVDLQRFNGKKAFAEYSTFYIGNEADKYRLTVSGYNGTAGDSLAWHNGMKFSTKDQDNDNWSSSNCASTWHGAWWYNECHKSNLNGAYAKSALSSWSYPVWEHWKRNEALKQTVIMIRYKY